MCNRVDLSSILDALSRQIRCVAIVAASAGEATEFNRAALRGGGDILHTIACALDDVSSLPLPTLSELGDEVELLSLAQLRTENRRASELIERVKRLGVLRASNLSERLKRTLEQVEALESDLNDIDTEDLGDRCYEIHKNIRQRSRDVANHVESCIAEVRYQHDGITSILSALEVAL